MRFAKTVLGAMAIASLSGLAFAAGPDPDAGYFCDRAMGPYGPGYGPPMMSGYGPGTMGEYGPGMMRGYGPGMMGGPWHGPGMMSFGYGMQYALGLTDEQRKKIDAIHEELHGKVWDIMGKMRSEMVKMQELTAADSLDRAALDAAYRRLSDLRQQRFDAQIDAHSQIDSVLTKEQKEHLKEFGPRWLSEAD